MRKTHPRPGEGGEMSSVFVWTVSDVFGIALLGFIRIAFADALKSAAKAIFTLTDSQLWGAEKDTVDPYWEMTRLDWFDWLLVASAAAMFAHTVVRGMSNE